MSNIALQRILDAVTPKDEELMRKIGSGIVFGTVRTVAPLTVEIEGRLLLTEEFLVVSFMCKRYVIRARLDVETDYTGGSTHTHAIETAGQFSHDHTLVTGSTGRTDTYSYPGHTHTAESVTQPEHRHEINDEIEIELWRGLQPGDVVNMIMSSNKQAFYIIERQNMEGTIQ